jgi:hypothetical protein
LDDVLHGEGGEDFVEVTLSEPAVGAIEVLEFYACGTSPDGCGDLLAVALETRSAEGFDDSQRGVSALADDSGRVEVFGCDAGCAFVDGEECGG